MVNAETYVPERGDVIWISLDPQAGHEQAGRRPAVVLSPKSYNGKIGLVLICPITNQIKGYPFEVSIKPGFSVKGVILADQVKNVDWQARKIEFICCLPDESVSDVLEKLRTLLTI